jgi:hypothetical protein
VAALLDESVEVDPEVLARDLSPMPIAQKLEHKDFLTYANFLANHISQAKPSTPNLNLEVF